MARFDDWIREWPGLHPKKPGQTRGPSFRECYEAGAASLESDLKLERAAAINEITLELEAYRKDKNATGLPLLHVSTPLGHALDKLLAEARERAFIDVEQFYNESLMEGSAIFEDWLAKQHAALRAASRDSGKAANRRQTNYLRPINEGQDLV